MSFTKSRGALTLLSVSAVILGNACSLIHPRSKPATPAEEAAAERAASDEFLRTAATERGAEQTPSGLIIIQGRRGTGRSPAADGTVTIDYTARLRDGEVIDNSQSHGPVTVPLSRVISCWQEGLQRLRVGGSATLICPAALAYGEGGVPPLIKPNAALVFNVELVDAGRPLSTPGH